MHVKICGITNLSDAELSIQHGAQLLGFNFYSKSPRYISMDIAKKIISPLPKSILKVGLFIDSTYDVINRAIDTLGLDLVQIYTPIQADKDFYERVIFALQAEKEEDLPAAHILNQYAYLLLDAPKTSDGLHGGTGRLANWSLATRLAREYRLFLAGGLTPHNVQSAIHHVQPYAIDVASGVERMPGVKDETQLKHFFKECKYDI